MASDVLLDVTAPFDDVAAALESALGPDAVLSRGPGRLEVTLSPQAWAVAVEDDGGTTLVVDDHDATGAAQRLVDDVLAPAGLAATSADAGQ